MPHSTRLDKVLSVFRKHHGAKTPSEKDGASPQKQCRHHTTPTRSLFATPKHGGTPRYSGRKSRTSEKEENLIPASRPISGLSPSKRVATGCEGDAGIRVVVRVRPRNQRELTLGGATCLQIRDDEHSICMVPPAESHAFSFDTVAGEAMTQEEVYSLAGRPVVENALRGYNGCLLAYGQTGSGKTYTMLGEAEDRQQRGIIPRIFEDLFEIVQSEPDIETSIECSFLEIYNETITDLLEESGINSSGLALREDGKRGVFVEGLRKERVINIDDVYKLLQVGMLHRRVGETQMNERSSRSHSVFSATIERRTHGRATVLRSRLHLVDLAGSERQKSSGATGERLKEASAINKSLSSLGMVISSLVDQQQGKNRHIPYRDSKLTFLLQDSLGGNAKTVLVAAVSPSSINASETLSTLRFADSAKRIKNKATINNDTDGDSEMLRKEIEMLRQELAMARAGNHSLTMEDSNAVLPGAREILPLGIPATDVSKDQINAADLNLEATRIALIGALRREENAAAQASSLDAELKGLRELLAAKDSALNRLQMMLKLKESRLERNSKSVNKMQMGEEVGTLIAALQEEIRILKLQYDSHPEVKRFAVENLHLCQEISRLQSVVDNDEINELSKEIDVLRKNMIAMQDDLDIALKRETDARAKADTAAANLSSMQRRMEKLMENHKQESENSGSGFVTAEEDRMTDRKQHADTGHLADLEKENDELRWRLTEIDTLKEQSTRLIDHAGRLESESEYLRNSLKNAHKDLEYSEASYLSVLEDLVEHWEKVSDMQQYMTNQNVELNTIREQLEIQKTNFEEQINCLEGRLNESHQSEQYLLSSIEETKTDNGNLVLTIDNLKKENSKLVNEMDIKTKQLDESIQLLESQEKKLKDMEEKLASAKADMESSESKALQAQSQALKQAERVAALQSALKHKEGEINSLMAKHSVTSSTDNNILQDELKSAKEALAQADIEQKRLREALAESMSRSSELNEQLENVENALAEAEYELSDKSATLTELKAQLSTVETSLVKSKASEKAASEKAEELKGQLERAIRSGNASERERGILMEKVQNLESVLSENRKKSTSLNGPLEQEQQLMAAKKQASDFRRRLEACQEHIKKLEQQLQIKNEELGKIKSEMQSEVTEAAQMVQKQLEAFQRAEIAEEKVARLERKLKEMRSQT